MQSADTELYVGDSFRIISFAVSLSKIARTAIVLSRWSDMTRRAMSLLPLQSFPGGAIAPWSLDYHPLARLAVIRYRPG